jgi:hypothetical protein
MLAYFDQPTEVVILSQGIAGLMLVLIGFESVGHHGIA